MDEQLPAGPVHFLRSLLIAASLFAVGVVVAALLTNGAPGTSAGMALWIAGAVFAAAALLGALATFMDGLAGLAPRELRWLYPIAFVIAMFAWVLGIIFVIALLVAMLVGGEGSSGPFDGFRGYGDFQPKNRADDEERAR